MRVIIADDHRLMREGTAALLAADPRIEVVGLASDGREAVELAARLEPDVALLDVGHAGRRRGSRRVRRSVRACLRSGS